MRQQPFGSGGPNVSVIGQGTWYLDRGDRKRAIAALRRGIDAGMTHIDTAEMYGDAELVIADAIAGRREGLFLVSKVLPGNASRRGTITACERSLQRLKTDYLDCYLLHWRGSYALEETFAAFDELQAAGKIRSWGVSNFDEDDLDEALAVAVDEDPSDLGGEGVFEVLGDGGKVDGAAGEALAPGSDDLIGGGLHRFSCRDGRALPAGLRADPEQPALARRDG